MLVNMNQLIQPAKKKGYGVIGACPMDRDQVRWCFETAAQLRAPLICCKHASVLSFADAPSLEEMADVVKYYARKFPEVPVALCLDHGDTYEDAARAIAAGFTGTMVDRSMDPLEENIRVMKEVVEMAHAADAAVEAGLGGTTWRDPTPEEILEHMTKEEELVRLVAESGVDAVAVFVGGSHGDHKAEGETILHYDLIERLNKATPAALVMHGSSDTGYEKLAQACKAGLVKFNVAGDTFKGGVAAYEAYCAEAAQEGITLHGTMSAIEAGYKKVVGDYMKFLRSTNLY